MRWTPALYKRSIAFGWRRLWGGKRVKYPDYPVRIPQAIADKGVEVVDLNARPEREEWRPPVDDPRFYRPPKLEDLVNYNEDPAFVCTPNLCIHQGVKQAASLAKAQVFHGLPPAVDTILQSIQPSDLTNTLLQRYIMLAQYWNTTREKLPRRIDPRKPGWRFQTQYGIPAKKQAGILISNLLRLCQTHVASYPSLGERRQIFNPYINSHYFYKGKPVVVRGLLECLVTSDRPLPRFADEDSVDASVEHPLLDMYPMMPTIDLLQDHRYTLEHNTGLRSEWKNSHLHTLVITDNNFYKTDQRVARDILFCLAYTVAQARQRFGDVSRLPEPVCVQSVSLDHQTLSFVGFQLNTLSLDSNTGVKNQVWVDGGNHLFQKILAQPWMPKAVRDERLEDLDPSVFHKLLAVYLYGASEDVQGVSVQGV
ncbi:large ribosomal subunit protein mL37-like isoform X2 [Babylonia areolata]|uniref:large ribosomal subunit protein mL37-like isoform X2 n=1 Tax=Babylonia areolata TaxID=304850 RepID=UPI003FD374F8